MAAVDCDVVVKHELYDAEYDADSSFYLKDGQNKNFKFKQGFNRHIYYKSFNDNTESHRAYSGFIDKSELFRPHNGYSGKLERLGVYSGFTFTPEIFRDRLTVQDVYEANGCDAYKFSYPAGYVFDEDFPMVKSNHKHKLKDGPHTNPDGITQKRKRTGEKRRAGGTSPYTSVPLPPCKVCSGVATGYHFGVITCEACKVSEPSHEPSIHN